MEQRKLIRLGNSSFAIALPKPWVSKSNLKKGDKIFLEENSNGEIIVTSEFKKNEGDDKKIDIILEKNDGDLIKKNFHAAYTKGYNLVVFKGDLKDSKKIKNILNQYVGFEIINSNSDEIIAKDFFDIKEARFENFVRRIDNNLREMFDMLLSEIKKDSINTKNLKEMVGIDESVNKFYFLCSRIFLKGIDNPSVLNILKMDSSKLFNNWWVSFHLESLGDGLKYTFKELFQLNTKDKNHACDILSRLHKEYIKSMEAFYEEDSKKSSEVVEETKKIRQEIEKLSRKNPKILKIAQALDVIEKNIYQNAKMTLYMRY